MVKYLFLFVMVKLNENFILKKKTDCWGVGVVLEEVIAENAAYFFPG